MNKNKKGAISFEQIVLFIMAIVVLVLVVVYFTGTFKRLQGPVNATISEIEKGVDCKNACDSGDSNKYSNLGCSAVLSKDFANCKS